MPPPRGSGFVGLGQYLQANQQQAQQMGNAIAQGIEQEGAATKQATDDAVRTFNDAAGVSATYNTLGGAPGSYGAAPAAMANVDTANRVLAGPQELGGVVDVDALNARASSLGDRARMGGSDAGVSVLMAQQGKGANTQGGRNLDSFLARRGAGERLDNAATAYGRLGSYVGAAQEQAKTAGAAARDRAKGAIAGASPYLGGLPAPQQSAQPTPVARPGSTLRSGVQALNDPRNTEEARRMASRYSY